MSKIKLPVIDDELWDEYNETDLMTWKYDGPHWTQLAVDFACVFAEKADRYHTALAIIYANPHEPQAAQIAENALYDVEDTDSKDAAHRADKHLEDKE